MHTGRIRFITEDRNQFFSKNLYLGEERYSAYLQDVSNRNALYNIRNGVQLDGAVSSIEEEESATITASVS